LSSWETLTQDTPLFFEQTIMFDMFAGYLAQTCSPLLTTHALSFDVDLGAESCRSRRRLLVSPAQKESV
jgi:hypothetical protein